jgi:hypothetical protein
MKLSDKLYARITLNVQASVISEEEIDEVKKLEDEVAFLDEIMTIPLHSCLTRNINEHEFICIFKHRRGEVEST